MSKKSVSIIHTQTLRDMKVILKSIAENEREQTIWIETVLTESWQYSKKSDYYLAKKSLSNLSEKDFEKQMAVEFCQTVGGSQR
jgi:hypothetical protein